jgi:hypothetical protein
MIFTRRFGALAARPQFPDSPELLQELGLDIELKHGENRQDDGDRRNDVRETTAA